MQVKLAGCAVVVAMLMAGFATVSEGKPAPPRKVLMAEVHGLSGSIALDAGRAEATAVLGRRGFMCFEDPERWQTFRRLLAGFGWQEPTDHPLAKIDFLQKKIIVFSYTGADGNCFLWSPLLGCGETEPCATSVEVIIGHAPNRARAARQWHFLCLAVPSYAMVSMEVYSAAGTDFGASRQLPPRNQAGETPAMPPDPYLWLPGATLTREENHHFREADEVDGLSGALSSVSQTVRAGEDIGVVFTLHYQSPQSGPVLGEFCPGREEALVWDGKYSNGYRNYGFLVKMPDGQRVTLLPKKIEDWSKNAPHLVAVTQEQPYVLPNWVEGETVKSLQALELDTTKPGQYVIIGLYGQDGGVSVEGQDRHSWGGRIRTNMITISVEAEPQ